MVENSKPPAHEQRRADPSCELRPPLGAAQRRKPQAWGSSSERHDLGPNAAIESIQQVKLLQDVSGTFAGQEAGVTRRWQVFPA
jgi:hypothetical protein